MWSYPPKPVSLIGYFDGSKYGSFSDAVNADDVAVDEDGNVGSLRS